MLHCVCAGKGLAGMIKDQVFMPFILKHQFQGLHWNLKLRYVLCGRKYDSHKSTQRYYTFSRDTVDSSSVSKCLKNVQ